MSRKEYAIKTHGHLYPLLHLSTLTHWEVIRDIVKSGGYTTRKELIEMLVKKGMKSSAASGKVWAWKESNLLIPAGGHGTMQVNTPLLRTLRDNFLELIPNPATKQTKEAEKTYKLSFVFDLEINPNKLPRKVHLHFTGKKHPVKWSHGEGNATNTAKITCEVLMLGNTIEQILNVTGVY